MKLILAFALGLCAATAWAGNPPAILKLSQARLAMPTLTAYLDVQDTGGRPVADLQPGQFTATLGETKLPVEQIQPFEKSGEGVAYVFLVDVSLSVKPEQFAKVRAALSAWAGALAAQDRMAVLSFGDAVKQVADFTADPAKLKEAIQALKPTDKHTALHQGLIQAMQMGRRADSGLPGRRAVVVLSDGLDDLSGGATREEVLRQMETDRVPVYAMGLDKTKKKADSKTEDGIRALGLFARSSGGDYVSVGGQALEKVYAGLRERIRQAVVARLDCRKCPADGRVQRLQITLQEGGVALSDGGELRALPPMPVKTEPAQQKQAVDLKPDQIMWNQPWVYAGLALAGVLLATGIYFAFRRKPPEDPPPTELPDTGESLTEGIPAEIFVAAADTAQRAAPNLPRSRIKLVEMHGKTRGKTYELEISGEATIGRGSGCDVAIAGDAEISSRHCALVRKNQAVFLRELGSTNGTQVNGVPIVSDYRLQEGDIIGVGRTELRVLLLGNLS